MGKGGDLCCRRNPIVLVWSIPTSCGRNTRPEANQESSVAIPPASSGPILTSGTGSRSQTGRRRRNPTVLIWSIPTSTYGEYCSECDDYCQSQSHRPHLVNSHMLLGLSLPELL